MKYCIFSFEGTGFPLAYKLIRDGFEVEIGRVMEYKDILSRQEIEAGSNEDPRDRLSRLKLYTNIVPTIPADLLLQKLKKVKNPRDYFIFFDSNTLYPYSQALQGMGFHGYFPIEEDRLFEINRDKAKDFVRTYYPSLKVAPKKAFTNVTEAQKFLLNDPGIWVLKSQTDDIPTFVPETNNESLARRQVLENLHTFKKYYEESGFMLEKKLKNIIEITPEKMYYNGTPLCTTINFENKFIGSGNLSFQVGCAGDLVFPITEGSRIEQVTFPPIVDTMAKEHEGLFIWDASLLIDPDSGDIYFGEFCPNRPGYNSFFTELELSVSVNSFFESVTEGKNPFQIGKVASSLMLFNMQRDSDDNMLTDISIDITQETLNHAWPYDVYRKSDEDFFRSVGYDFLISPITASGNSIQEAVDRMYGYIDGFAMSKLYYRPKFDFLSKEYATSILNRLKYSLETQLFPLPFSTPFSQK